MAAEVPTRAERIRALIEETDRVLRDSERMTSHLDRSMKQPFWPDRRRTVRVPFSEEPGRGGGDHT